MLPRIRSQRDPAVAHPVVCVAAAIDELLAWGAELARGEGRPGPRQPALRSTSWRPSCSAACRCPTMVLPGNHDGGNTIATTPPPRWPPTDCGSSRTWRWWTWPGVRIIGVDTRTTTQAGTVQARTPSA